jgi:rhamnose transport system ATP-binding protein
MDTIDDRFSDPYLDPKDSDLSVYSEKTIRLDGYWCYQPIDSPTRSLRCSEEPDGATKDPALRNTSETGVVGAGRSLKGTPVRVDSPTQAVELGIAYVPEDRRRHGVVLEMSVAANTTLAILQKISTGGLIDFSREAQIAGEYVQRFGIKTPSLDSPVGNLSGGNQQKVALARWLATGPCVMILDEPTQGVDVGAKAEIHRLMGELAKNGMAIILISSELPEVLGMSDRIAVMHAGRIMGTLDRAEATQERVLAMALGHTAEVIV